jgi:chemotaxis signal transduction protein
VNPVPATRAIVLFRIDGTLLGLDVREVEEVTPVLAITRVPGTSSRIAGIVRWRGATIPVMDLRAKPEPSPRPASMRARLVLVKRPERFGILIDRAEGVHDAETAFASEPLQLLDPALLFQNEGKSTP